MSLYSTIWGVERQAGHVDMAVLDRHRNGIAAVFRRVRTFGRGDAVLLNGALGPKDYFIDLLFGAYLRFFRRDVVLLISDATWHPRTVQSESRVAVLFRLYAVFQKRLLLLCDSPHTHYCFLSRNEVATFAAESGVDPRRIHFTQFCSQLPPEILEEIQALSRQPPIARTVFAGGNSLRDYETLIAASIGFDGNVTIASSNASSALPSNVTLGAVPHLEFFRIMARSAVVVVPLLPTDKRSVGQQTYLNALALGKPCIVSDVSGVRDHLDAGTHAFVVPPQDVDALRDAIVWAVDPENAEAVLRMADAGRRLADTMTFAHYYGRLGHLLAAINSARA